MIKTKNFSADMLSRFRDYQQISFAILEQMAATLEAGQTEKEVAHALVRCYRDAGVKSFFHLPVVLFGERTALPGDWPIGKFFPKSRALLPGDSIILDASPLFDGYLVDTSYSCCFGDNPVHRQMMLDLAGFRDSVCNAINNAESFKSIAERVNYELQSMGYQAVHNKHPGAVLGHRAIKIPNLPFAWRFQGFDALSLSWFIYKGRLANTGLGRESPLWNAGKTSDHLPHDGLWLVEPHAGLGEVGAKWEEILVIQDGHGYWLDDNPPHVKQWRNINQGSDYRPIPQSA